MATASATDPRFLATVKEWLQAHSEILLLIRYSHSAGAKSFEFFTVFQKFSDRIYELPPRTSVIVFRTPQLIIRGVVDDDFVTSCVRRIPDGAEYLMVETALRSSGRVSWFHNAAGTSHEELRADLKGSHGVVVAVGIYPPWLADSDDVISAVIPSANGEIVSGIY